MPPQSLIESVVEILAPDVGALIARAAVTMFLAKAGLSETEVQAKHMVALAQTVRPGLKTFVGGERAGALAARIARLGEEHGARA